MRTFVSNGQLEKEFKNVEYWYEKWKKSGDITDLEMAEFVAKSIKDGITEIVIFKKTNSK